MSQKRTRKISNRNGDSHLRKPIRTHDLRPGYIVWLPPPAIEICQMIRRFDYHNKVQRADIDQVLRPEAYNHPVVVLEITNLSSGGSDRDDFVIAAMVTSFGNTTGCEDTCRLHTRGTELWGSHLAIHPSTHPSNTNVLYLEKRKLDKPSYVKLERIYMPISALKTYTRGLMAAASDIHLKRESLGILLREIGMKAPESWERGPGVGRETTTIPPSPSLPVLSTRSRLFTPCSMPYHPQTVAPKDNWGESWKPGPSVRGTTVVPSSPSLPMMSFSDTLSTPRSMPYRPQISVREDTLLITNTQRLSQPVPSSYTRDNYGSIDTYSLPPPATWSPRGRTSKTSRISSSIGRDIFLPCFQVALCLLLLGFIVSYIPWASIGSIFTKIGHSLTSNWSWCWGFVANGWSSFVIFFRNNRLTLVAWLKSLVWK